jgi:hypothetical protein
MLRFGKAGERQARRVFHPTTQRITTTSLAHLSLANVWMVDHTNLAIGAKNGRAPHPARLLIAHL